MFQAPLAHRQEFRNCVCSLWYLHVDLQGEHKVFTLLQTFIMRKLREIRTYFLPLLKLVSKKLLELSYILKKNIYLYYT